MKKRGISAIVATVLMILIVVAGIGIIWSVILPTITIVDIESNEQAISIDTQGGYTVYDVEEKIACVKVRKETDKIIEGLKMRFVIEGSSHPFSSDDSDEIPALNNAKTYCFDLAAYGVPTKVIVSTLPENSRSSVVEADVPTKVLNSVFVTSSRSGVGEYELIKLDDDPTVIHITECMNLTEEGMTYILQNDITTDIGCFRVRANDITLDLGGYKINSSDWGDGGGPDKKDYGVSIWGNDTVAIKDVTVKNGEIDSFGLGVTVGYADSVKVADIYTYNCSWEGLLLYHVSNSSFVRIRANSNVFQGILFSGQVSSSSFDSITTNSNGFQGIGMGGLWSVNNIFTNIVASFNRQEGIKANTGNNTFTNVVVDSNNFGGMVISSTSDNNRLSNIVSTNNSYGISLLGEGAHVENSMVCNNTNADFSCSNSSDDYSEATLTNTYSINNGCGAWLGESVGSC